MLFDVGSTFSKLTVNVWFASLYEYSKLIADTPLIETLSFTNSTKLVSITSVIIGDS